MNLLLSTIYVRMQAVGHRACLLYKSQGLAVFFFFYLQHVPLQILILYAWKDHRTRFTLYTFPSYFRLIPMAICVLFVFLDL